MATAAPLTINIELWQLITFLIGLLLAFFGAAFALGKLLLTQIEKRLEQRFQGQDESRRESQKHWDTKFAALEKAADDERLMWRKLERELMDLKAELPLSYVRREDQIITQSRIEAKIDSLALRLESIPH